MHTYIGDANILYYLYILKRCSLVINHIIYLYTIYPKELQSDDQVEKEKEGVSPPLS